MNRYLYIWYFKHSRILKNSKLHTCNSKNVFVSYSYEQNVNFERYLIKINWKPLCTTTDRRQYLTPPSFENGKKIKEELWFENLYIEQYKTANKQLPVLRIHIHWAIPWAGCVRWAEVQRYGRQGVTGSSERTVAGWPGCSATLGTQDSWHCGVHECYSTDWTLVKDNHLQELL